jgi:predicted AAA+ superfamily ATPase
MSDYLSFYLVEVDDLVNSAIGSTYYKLSFDHSVEEEFKDIEKLETFHLDFITHGTDRYEEFSSLLDRYGHQEEYPPMTISDYMGFIYVGELYSLDNDTPEKTTPPPPF